MDLKIEDMYVEKHELEAFDSYVAAAISGFTSNGMATTTIEKHAANDSIAVAYKVLELRRQILKNARYVESDQ